MFSPKLKIAVSFEEKMNKLIFVKLEIGFRKKCLGFKELQHLNRCND